MDRPCGRPTRGGGPPALVNRTSSGPFRRRSVASWSPSGAMTPACRPPVRARQRAQLPVPVGEPGGSYGSEFVAVGRGCQRTSRKPRKFFESSYLSRGTRAQCPLAATRRWRVSRGRVRARARWRSRRFPRPDRSVRARRWWSPDTDTGAPTAAESTASASARRGPSRGRLPITWIATLPISKPASRTRRTVSASRAVPAAPAHAGSAVPKVLPRSPSPAAESSASQAACAATSASE